jgi:hypothetical protein
MIYLASYRDKIPEGSIAINTTSRSNNWSRGLSPFFLRPLCAPNCYNVENLYQFSKCYKQHIGEDSNPTEEWFKWRDKGFGTSRAVRYPMGKGALPEYSYWYGNKYSYVEARKHIYFPVYSQSVVMSEAYEKLYELYKTETEDIYLIDFDGYNHDKLGMTLKDVINDPDKKMGHAFCIKAVLMKDVKPGTKLKVKM